MTCWVNKLSWALAFFPGCLFALLLAAPVMAQAPIPLRPPSIQPPASEAPLAGPAEDAISTGALAEPDFASIGLMTSENGGFGADMWQGADRALVEQLLTKIPATVTSPALQRLRQRLLLSAAAPPQGASSGVSFLGLRLRRLIEAGQFEPAGQMAALAGSASKDETVLQARADIALAQNELKTACDLAAAQVRTSSAVYWLKLSGFCHVMNANEAAAQLTASLVAEQDADDAGYQSLLTALIAKSGKTPKSLPSPDILQMAMIRFASLPLPEKISGNISPASLKLMALMPGASAESRLVAMERAEAAGAIGPEEVAKLYAEIPFSVEDRANASDLAPKLPAAKANALMFQSIRGQDSPASLTLALSRAWSLARASGSFATAARVNLTPARDLVPGPEMIGAAADAGRALLAAGDMFAAQRWYDLALALSRPGNNPEAAKAALALWPLLRLALPPEALPDDPDKISAWLSSLPPDVKTRQGPVLLSAMSGLGLAASAAEWVNLTQDATDMEKAFMPPAAILHLLMDASQNGRAAQTVLLSLSCAGENGEGLANPFLLGIIIRALNSAGLQAEARSLAVEAALQAGI